MNNVLRKISDFRLITLAVASTLAIAAANADARQGDARVKAAHNGGTTSVQRHRGADGAVDATRTNRKGGVTTVDRYKDGAGTTDATITGPRGGVTNVDRTRGADGVMDKTVTGPKGGVTTTDRSRGSDGLVDKTSGRRGPHGAVAVTTAGRDYAYAGCGWRRRQDGHRSEGWRQHGRPLARSRRCRRCNGDRPERKRQHNRS